MNSFLALFKRSGKDRGIYVDLDELRSQDGGMSVGSAAATDITIYDVPADKNFHIANIVLTSPNTKNLVHLYATDAAGKRAGPPYVIGAGESIAIGNLEGIQLSETELVYAQLSTAATVYVHVGGKLVDNNVNLSV